MKQREMPFRAHFEELRKRLIFIAIFLVVGLGVGFLMAPLLLVICKAFRKRRISR
nr:hypothetical protein [Salicibibacter halophilus]